MIRTLVLLASTLVVAAAVIDRAHAGRSDMPWMGPGMMDEHMGGGMMGRGGMGMMGRGGGQLMQRHMAYMQGLPSTYAGLANPLRPTPEVL